MRNIYALIILTTIISTLTSCVTYQKERNYDKIVDENTYWYIKDIENLKEYKFYIYDECFYDEECLDSIISNAADSTNSFYKSIKIPAYITKGQSYYNKDSIIVYPSTCFFSNELALKLYINNFLAENNEQFRYKLDTTTYEKIFISDIDSVHFTEKIGYKLTDITNDKTIFSKSYDVNINDLDRGKTETFFARMNPTSLNINNFIKDLKYFGVKNKPYPSDYFPDTLVIKNIKPLYPNRFTLDMGYGKTSLYDNEVFFKIIFYGKHQLYTGVYMLVQYDRFSSETPVKTPAKLDAGIVSRYYFGKTEGIYIGGSLGFTTFSYTPEGYEDDWYKSHNDPIEIEALSTEINLGYLWRISNSIGLGIETFYQYNFTDDIKEIGFTKSSFGARTYFTLFM